jgi:N-acetyl sugar amidotransferase
MPDTRPGMIIDDEGVCSACRNYEKQKSVDWTARYSDLEKLCSKYRGMNGSFYDCAIAVSSGKDSHFQVHILKEEMKMNPILFTVEDNFTMTEAGKHNLKNISKEFACNIVSLKPDIETQRRVMRYTFEKYGKPTWFIDRLIYTYPIFMAMKLNTPLLVYGENINYTYGGQQNEETYSSKSQLKNGVASDIPIDELVKAADVSKESLEFTKAFNEEQLESIDPVYLSYFLPWNSYSNYIFAKSRGFHDLTHEWDRTDHIENFDQIDTQGYLVHSWMKYPKFGHQAVTDYASRFIRYGLMHREQAIDLVNKCDHKLDPICVRDFCDFLGYSETEFWKIVDKHYNGELFRKNSFGQWEKKFKLV